MAHHSSTQPRDSWGRWTHHTEPAASEEHPTQENTPTSWNPWKAFIAAIRHAPAEQQPQPQDEQPAPLPKSQQIPQALDDIEYKRVAKIEEIREDIITAASFIEPYDREAFTDFVLDRLKQDITQLEQLAKVPELDIAGIAEYMEKMDNAGMLD